MVILNLTLAIAPAVIVIYFILTFNAYKQQDIKITRRIILAGFFSAFCSAVMNAVVYRYTVFDPFSMDFLIRGSGYFFTICLNEEFFKLLFILIFFYTINSDMDEADRILYPVSVGAVFAVFEGVTPVYFETYTLALRIIINIPFHILNTFVMVYFINRLYNSKGFRSNMVLLGAWLVPVLLHWFFKSVLFFLYGWFLMIPGIIISSLFIYAVYRAYQLFYKPVHSEAYGGYRV